MKFADWFRGVENVALAAVNKVFDETRAVVSAAPFLPANIRADVTQLINDAQSDLNGAAGLAGTLAGATVANGIDDITTLLLNTANALTNSKSIADFSNAEKTVLLQTWSAMKAQGDTLVAQFHAGIDPTAPKTNDAPVTQPGIVPPAH